MWSFPTTRTSGSGKKSTWPAAPSSSGAGLPLGERIGAVREGLNYFHTHMQAMAEEISCQMGKPLVQSRGEFGGFFERAD